MRRWGQIAESKPDNWYMETAKSVYRPDIYALAAKELIAEGKTNFFDQIFTSLVTVFTGFLLGSLIAIPIGILSGLSQTLYQAINPLVQIFKPVSPLAWLPLVTMVVSNVSQILRLHWLTHVWKIVLPSALPMIFTGLRLSLGIGWMVLIAAEMLAQNPGLGKFIWDEFQNSGSDSLGRIMVAVLVIGLIGYVLDRIMLALQAHVSWDKNTVLR